MIGNKPITAVDAFQLMLIYLKLSGQIQWSWVYVLAPLIIIIGLWVGLHALKETLVTLNQWLNGEEHDEQERQTSQRNEVQRDDQQAEAGWSDSEADERRAGDTDKDGVHLP